MILKSKNNDICDERVDKIQLDFKNERSTGHSEKTDPPFVQHKKSLRLLNNLFIFEILNKLYPVVNFSVDFSLVRSATLLRVSLTISYLLLASLL